MSNEHEDRAKALLPCTWGENCSHDTVGELCPAYYRPAVAAALAEQDKKIGELTSAYNVRNDEVTGLQGMLAESKAEVVALRAKLAATEDQVYAERYKAHTANEQVAALRERIVELEQFKAKYNEAMDIMAEWKNIDDTSAIAERWNKRLAAARVEGLREAKANVCVDCAARVERQIVERGKTEG